MYEMAIDRLTVINTLQTTKKKKKITLYFCLTKNQMSTQMFKMSAPMLTFTKKTKKKNNNKILTAIYTMYFCLTKTEDLLKCSKWRHTGSQLYTHEKLHYFSTMCFCLTKITYLLEFSNGAVNARNYKKKTTTKKKKKKKKKKKTITKNTKKKTVYITIYFYNVFRSYT